MTRYATSASIIYRRATWLVETNLLVAAGITKRFGPTLALDAVDFHAAAGSIHALIGENGAGKSTLINVLTGRVAADSGTITLDGNPMDDRSPAACLRAGIAAVFQSPMLFEQMSWEENLVFGGFERSGSRLDLAAIRTQARGIAEPLAVPLPRDNAPITTLSVSDRVRLEIIRTLSYRPRVLILDEPTSVLGPAELERFLDMLRHLRGQGRVVILVTHKLREALAVADDITILRGGRKVAERRAGETDEPALARLMIGELPEIVSAPEDEGLREEPLLLIDKIGAEHDRRRVLDNASLEINRGEIVGVAGVDGNGQNELAALLAGAIHPSSGVVAGSAADAIAVLPQNRDLDGLILEMPLWENMLLARPLRRRFVGSFGNIDRGAARAFAAENCAQYGIRVPGAEIAARALSGGNRQRLTIARALASDPAVIVAHDICRGLDFNATAEVHRRLRSYAAGGGGVLLISTDLDEIFALCHRIYVISSGHLTEVSADKRNPEDIGMMMSGAS
ncbi:MAG TPA: ATP-binding cassette domain-containing protein [Candidatus Binataceae bacterium]|nr:ATP-binding cassette domain-containing protein [Candidatus Binataceae bacterium]